MYLCFPLRFQPVQSLLVFSTPAFFSFKSFDDEGSCVRQTVRWSGSVVYCIFSRRAFTGSAVVEALTQSIRSTCWPAVPRGRPVGRSVGRSACPVLSSRMERDTQVGVRPSCASTITRQTDRRTATDQAAAPLQRLQASCLLSSRAIPEAGVWTSAAAVGLSGREATDTRYRR